MARGRKGGPSRMDMRRQAEAAEARGKDDDEHEEEEEEAGEEEAEADEGDGDEEAKPKKPKPKPKPKKPAAPKKPTTKRVRAVKEVRRRAVWVVYDNSQKPVDTFPFNQKAEAEALLARKLEEKKGTFYLNLVKEEIKE
jgi:hypothetical protein